MGFFFLGKNSYERGELGEPVAPAWFPRKVEIFPVNSLYFARQVLMLEKAALKQNMPLAIAGASPSVARALKWSGLRHLIEKETR
jgi:hypothetical protein